MREIDINILVAAISLVIGFLLGVIVTIQAYSQMLREDKTA